MNITAIVLDGQALNGYRLQRQRTITVRVSVVGSGLTGGKLKFVAKDSVALTDLTDAGSSIIKTTPTQITVDSAASTDQIMIARFDITPLDTQSLVVDTLYWGIQFETAAGIIPFNELQGTLKIENDRVKTMV